MEKDSPSTSGARRLSIPTVVFGNRSIIWWGQWGMMAIEGTCLPSSLRHISFCARERQIGLRDILARSEVGHNQFSHPGSQLHSDAIGNVPRKTASSGQSVWALLCMVVIAM